MKKVVKGRSPSKLDALDQIVCRGLQFDLNLGFHRGEKGIRQKVVLDFEAWIKRDGHNGEDRVSSIKLDYYKAHRAIGSLIHSRRFKLVETVAEKIAEVLLHKFPIESVRVSVTKFPMDLPNMESVTYVCFRKKGGMGVED